MSTEIAPLTDQMRFAELVTSGTGQSILPDHYRGNPANVLIAVGLGQAMGLSPAESLYRIAVIKGKPSAGAELIAANVRRAGHKLRVTGDETSCTATIIRADDPDFPFTVTRDLEWAKRMGLSSNDNYRKQPGTMLQWRAITAVARLACPEALYGVAHTPDELSDMESAAARVSERSATARLQQVMHDRQPVVPDPDVVDAEEVPDPDPVVEGETGELASDAQHRALWPALTAAGFDYKTDDGKREVLAYMSRLTGRQVTTTKELTRREASILLDSLTTGQEAQA